MSDSVEGKKPRKKDVLDRSLERLAARAQGLVGDPEEVRFALLAFGRHSLLIDALYGAFGKPRLLVVTDQTVKLFKGNGQVKGNISEELASPGLEADLGELKGRNAKFVFPNGEVVYIPKAYFTRINEALGGSLNAS